MFDHEKTSEAFALANFVHKEQIRKDINAPYISHPMAVASKVLEWGGNEDQFMAALLHDVIEKCGIIWMKQIKENCGEKVLEMVLECSDLVAETPSVRTPIRTRKLAYIEKLKKISDEALLISMADVWHNFQSLRENHLDVGEGVGSFSLDQHERMEVMLWYFDQAIFVYEDRRMPQAEELRRLYNLIQSEKNTNS